MNARFEVHEINYDAGKPRYFVYDYENKNWGRIFDNKHKANHLCSKLNLEYSKALTEDEKLEVKQAISNILKELNE